jgi:hypothetical protein
MSESLFAGSRPMPKDPTRTYKIVVVKDGTYAVEVMPSDETPLRISGFRTKGEARTWIEGQETTPTTEQER